MAWSIWIVNLDGEEMLRKDFDDKTELYKTMARYVYRYDVGFGMVGRVTNGVWDVLYTFRPNFVGWQRGLRL